MQPGALDYRSQYGGNPYYNPYQNPLSMGQWLMIGAGALAVGGVGYWIYAKMKSTPAPTPVAVNAVNAMFTAPAANPQTHWHAA